MKRALSTLEPTVIAIGIMLLKEMVCDNKDDLSAFDEQLSNLLCTGRSTLDSYDTTSPNHQDFTKVWNTFCDQINAIELRQKLDFTIAKRRDNKTLQFLLGFVRIVKRLFTFIEAVRSRNWILYLASFEAMIKDFTSLDRIKYRRWSAVYLADMQHLKQSGDQ